MSLFSLLRLPTAAAFNSTSPSSSDVGTCPLGSLLSLLWFPPTPLWNDTDLSVILSQAPAVNIVNSRSHLSSATSLTPHDPTHHTPSSSYIPIRDDWSFMGAIGLHAKLSANVIRIK